MASISASTATSVNSRAALVSKEPATISSLAVPGFAQSGWRTGRIRCSSVDGKAPRHYVTAGVSLLASLMSMSSPALSLVDERMSTEGTGLPFGLSNNILGWILLGVFAIIWSLYFVYTSSLEEDDDSGLSL